MRTARSLPSTGQAERACRCAARSTVWSAQPGRSPTDPGGSRQRTKRYASPPTRYDVTLARPAHGSTSVRHGPGRIVNA